jgi:diguanylate cyclase (GGDEF)-like protein
MLLPVRIMRARRARSARAARVFASFTRKLSPDVTRPATSSIAAARMKAKRGSARRDLIDCGAGHAYRLGAPIGTTGAAQLVRARALDDGAPVILKLPDPALPSSRQFAVFRREYALLAGLAVAGVVRPLALFEPATQPVMLLPDFDGAAFETVLTRQRLAWPCGLHLACQLTRILAELHAAGLTRIDLRPANFLLGLDQTLCLIDLSRARPAAPPASGAGCPPATDPTHVAPEPRGAANARPDQRADLNRLGVTLLRLFAGQSPFDLDGAPATAHGHPRRAPRTQGAGRPDLPPAIAAIVLGLRATAPGARYASAAELLRDLQACQLLPGAPAGRREGRANAGAPRPPTAPGAAPAATGPRFDLLALENARLTADLERANTACHQAEERLRHQADHDALTGLPNRTLLRDRMRQAIALAHRDGSRVAILFIDLDCFKNINDSLGHHVGDVVLQMASARLRHCLREGDSVARLGGDEFVLSLPLQGDSGAAAQVASKALATLAQPFEVDGHALHVSASIGISVYPEDGADVDTLMRTADTAMYHAKEKGRANFQFFTAALNQAVQRRLDVGARLRHALAQGEFVLHYQPQVDMESGTTFSTEALLRWQPPGQAPISCGAFIGNAEESGLIVPIGEWVLRNACAQLKRWHDAGRGELCMAVNLSPRQLEQPGFCDLVARILAEAGIPACALELEITENILLRRSAFNLASLTRLSAMGIRLSVDDFGTGYSSLAYLQRFPVHALKIDQSFVRDIGKDSNDTALVSAIIAMAASLNLKVMAEGVETAQQARFLLAHGCHAGQGFYYSRALPAETLSAQFHASLGARQRRQRTPSD